MASRTVRIYYSSRLEGARYASDVELPESGGGTIRIGSDPSNELVLPGRHIPGMVAALVLAGASWRIEPFQGPCAVEGQELRVGRRWPIRPGQEVRLGEFTLTLEHMSPSGQVGVVDREIANLRAGDLIASLHGALLPRLPRTQESDSPQANDEHLLDVEHSIDDLCDRAFRVLEEPTIDHMAGLGVRAEMLRRIIEAEDRDGRSSSAAAPTWTKLISVVPELERDLDRLIRSLDSSMGLTHQAEVRGRIERLDRRFWPSWESSGSPMLDLGTRAYLARRYCKKEIKDLVFGFGPIEDLIRTPTVDEIMVNDSHHIFIEHCGVLKNSGRRFVSDAVTRAIIERIVAQVGRRIDRSQPIVDARMADGSRVNAVIPPIAVDGPSITIRKFRKGGFSISQLIEMGSMTPSVARFLRAAVRARKNVLVSGGTGTGKTTLLNCLGRWIPDTERIVTVEDTAELRLGHPHVVRLETRTRNLEGQGALTIRDLVRNALRMRPDRIIVGECRGAEALDMLQAMNTGHDGSLTTIHANSTVDVVQRLEGMILEAAPFPIPAIHRQVAAAVDLVVQIERRGKVRRVSEVSELAGYDARRGEIRVRRLFDFDPEAGRLAPTGSLPTFIDELIRDGGLAIELFYGDLDAEGPEGEEWT